MASNLTVHLDNGTSLDAYMASAATSQKACPALVICPEVFGVNRHMRSVADEFAQRGLLVVVPDMFWRFEPNMEIPYDEAGLKRGSEILEAFDVELGARDLGHVVDQVRKYPACNGKIGVLGFCIGGTLAYLAATRFGVDAAVAYYAKGIESRLDEAGKLSCGMVLHYGEADRFIPPAVIESVRAALASHPEVEIYTYPGVDHGFNSNDRKAYNPEAATLAMSRTLKLLGEKL